MFQQCSKFRHALITYISRKMINGKEKDELFEAFKAMDKDGNGILTREELIEGYTKVFGQADPNFIL
jgi:calcium-dependent protein kinase